MKLAWMRQDLASARRASALLLALLVGSMLVNLILAGFTYRLWSHERVVVVPPSVHKTFWVEEERVSAEYLEQMGYFLMQLTLNVTPQSVDHQSKLLLQYAAPAAYGELRTTLLSAAERLKRDGAATVFSARDLTVDERALKVGIRGQLTTFISDRRVSEVAKGYVIEFQYKAGQIFLKAFRETSPNDPLETRASPASPAPGA
jgi:conjugal transfer pilus assembly protein TraE